MHKVILLLGSNIRPEGNLKRCLRLLRDRVGILESSSVWETRSIGFDGPDFLNQALLISTPLDAPKLKREILRPVELELGRVRTANKNAPRTIDLDIVFFDDRLLDADLFRHAFRAVPVAQLLPDFRSPSGELLCEAASRLMKTFPILLKQSPPFDVPAGLPRIGAKELH